jgi:hypothetical protein
VYSGVCKPLEETKMWMLWRDQFAC